MWRESQYRCEAYIHAQNIIIVHGCSCVYFLCYRLAHLFYLLCSALVQPGPPHRERLCRTEGQYSSRSDVTGVLSDWLWKRLSVAVFVIPHPHWTRCHLNNTYLGRFGLNIQNLPFFFYQPNKICFVFSIDQTVRTWTIGKCLPKKDTVLYVGWQDNACIQIYTYTSPSACTIPKASVALVPSCVEANMSALIATN